MILIQTARSQSRVWGRHSPTSTIGQCAAISNFEIVATGRYLLIAFLEPFPFWIFKTCSAFQKVEGVFANRSVSCLWSLLTPNLRSCPCVAAALSGSPAFLRGCGAIARSRRLMQFSRFGYKELQAGGPAANSLGKIKKAAPQGTKSFCRRQAAAKWSVAAGRLFSILKWLVWVRGYHEKSKVSRK